MADSTVIEMKDYLDALATTSALSDSAVLLSKETGEDPKTVTKNNLTTGKMVYKGQWDADANDPTLGDSGAGGVLGDYYIVSVTGTTSIDGVADWEVGDWIVHNGTTWDKQDNSGVEEAPIDGKQYARKDADWEEVVIPAEVTVDTVPADEATHAISSQWAYGVDGQRTGWREEYSSTSQVSQASPVAGTWYNLGGSIGPFGANGEVWDISWTAIPYIVGSSLNDINGGLSETNNSMSSNEFKCQATLVGGSFTGMIIPMGKKLRKTLTGPLTLYLNAMFSNGSGTTLYVRGDLGKTQIVAQRIR